MSNQPSCSIPQQTLNRDPDYRSFICSCLLLDMQALPRLPFKPRPSALSASLSLLRDLARLVRPLNPASTLTPCTRANLHPQSTPLAKLTQQRDSRNAQEQIRLEPPQEKDLTTVRDLRL